MTRKTTRTMLRLDRVLLDGAKRFASKYGRSKHWALAYFCHAGSINAAPTLDTEGRFLPENERDTVQTDQKTTVRVELRIDALVLAMAQVKATAERSQSWWLVHWIETGAVLCGVSLFDVDGTSSRGWGHGIEWGDDIEYDDGSMGWVACTVLALGLNAVTVGFEDGRVLTDDPGKFRHREVVA